MPRHLTVGTAIDKSRIYSGNAYIPLIEIDILNSAGSVIETLYFARNSENITFRGNLYLAGNFTIDATQEVNQEPRVSITAQDQKKMLSSKLDQYDGGSNFPVRILIVNSDALDKPAEIEEEFKIQKSRVVNYVVTIELGAENPLSLRFPRRRQFKNRCGWRYKDSRCKYAGGLTECDFTFDGANGCVAHSNEINFGGFTGLKTIYGF